MDVDNKTSRVCRLSTRQFLEFSIVENCEELAGWAIWQIFSELGQAASTRHGTIYRNSRDARSPTWSMIQDPVPSLQHRIE